ncbi:GNAT family N-acetyltransferase [Paenibacillus thalictri]|uniref:GNAT family N-acetyltransferase n=1 Tax=Paenibacillus thalictri TaxID=2527873 RepID=A0A4V2J4B7_9BACL|nr:GNAT family N-acetyltransferase [Paenibacillus thalictri]TBL79022.1 GNAT family N-acetyltransferase [Paenibacillus thalictri]
MNIRLAAESDNPDLREVYLESRRNRFYWAVTENMKLDDFDRDTVDEVILLAEEDSRVAGFVSLYLPDNFIHHLFVHPDFFGKGAGVRLLQAAIHKMHTPVTLKCVSKNHKAMKFYEKNGWQKVVEESGAGEPYWIMRYE